MSTLNSRLFRFDHTKLVKGAKFYELYVGRLVSFTVTQDAYIDDTDRHTQVRWKGVQDQEGASPTTFLVTRGMEHYGPKIYLHDEIEEHNGRLFVTRD